MLSLLQLASVGGWLSLFIHVFSTDRLPIYCLLGTVLGPAKETPKKARRKDDPKKQGNREGFCGLEIVLASWTPPTTTEEGVGRKDELRDPTHNSLIQGPQQALMCAQDAGEEDRSSVIPNAQEILSHRTSISLWQGQILPQSQSSLGDTCG